MITAMRMSLIFKNHKEELELYITDVLEYEHEIEVYSECIHPSLKRGWNGNMTYRSYKAYQLPSANDIGGLCESCYC